MNACTPITFLCEKNSNKIYVKHEELYPFGFGGNKARIAEHYFRQSDRLKCDSIVTYGSDSSNLCRTVANMACARGQTCVVVSPVETSSDTLNIRLSAMFGARIVHCPVTEVSDTISGVLKELERDGHDPFFIPGGGNGITGTGAYVCCYDEIKEYEKINGIYFDRIFLASGTGTTQSGLVCGQLIYGDKRETIGISIARKNPRGRNEVIKSIKNYIEEKNIGVSDDLIEEATVFDDSFIGGGYSVYDSFDTVDRMLCKYGLVLDPVYTGKAYAGMEDIIYRRDVVNSNILFVHTGGIPLFFDRFFVNNRRDRG